MKSLRNPVRALTGLALLTPLFGSSLVVPAGLNPGDHYRIAFITSTARDYTSSDIADYNAFVNSAANASGSILAPLGINWLAIASSETVSAHDNIGGNFSDPVYLSDGTLIAANAADLWDGNIDATIHITETGTSDTHAQPWTATSSSGAIDFVRLDNVTVYPEVGNLDATTSWIYSGFQISPSDNLPLYGISATELTVPSGTPEPETMFTFGAGLLLLVTQRHRFRR